MTVIYCLLVLTGSYLFFIFAPAYVMYKAVFRRVKGKMLTERKLDNTFFAPFAAKIAEDFEFLKAAKTENVSVKSRDGTILTGSYYSTGSDKLAICFHGYGSTGENCFFAMGRYLLERGYDLLLVNERAHNGSGGECPTLGVLEQYDVLAWTEWAEINDKAQKIILAGVSMGCAGIALAADKIESGRVKALVLDCGYASPYGQIVQDLRSRKIPAGLVAPVMRGLLKHNKGIETKINLWESLERTEIPVLFIHGTEDETVPFSAAEENYSHCAAPKKLLRIEGGHHALAFPEGGEYAEGELEQFLTAWVERG